MWNLAPVIPDAARFSRIYRGRGELIDHLFASRWLVADGRLGEVHSCAALEAPLPSIDDDPTELRGRPGQTYGVPRMTHWLPQAGFRGQPEVGRSDHA